MGETWQVAMKLLAYNIIKTSVVETLTPSG
jgi:hypothetical protein